MTLLGHRFSCLWEKLNGAGSWTDNAYVYVVQFRRLQS